VLGLDFLAVTNRFASDPVKIEVTAGRTK